MFNPFGVNGIEAVLATIAVAVAVCICWKLTCEATVKVASVVCDAVRFAWASLERMVVAKK